MTLLEFLYTPDLKTTLVFDDDTFNVVMLFQKFVGHFALLTLYLGEFFFFNLYLVSFYRILIIFWGIKLTLINQLIINSFYL